MRHRTVRCAQSTLQLEEFLVVDHDGVVRLQAPPIYVQEPGHERTGHKYLYDSELGWGNIPNWTATTFGQTLSTNSKSLRDREYSYEKPTGWRRILVLGDSFTWGYGVGDSDIFTEIMETTFECDKLKWQVINTGVSGWGTDQEYLYFVREGAKYSPDIVVLAFYLGNDPKNCVGSIQYGLHKPVFLDMKLTLANVPVPKPPADGAQPIASSVERHTLAVRIIEELADKCKAVSAELAVMKFGVFQQPESPAVQAADVDFHLKLARIQNKIHYLDLDEEFRKRSLARPELTEGVEDGHWNAFGHRRVAEILRGFLSEQSLLE